MKVLNFAYKRCALLCSAFWSAGSETRGEDIKRGKVLVTISKPLVAQRAGGITLRCMLENYGIDGKASPGLKHVA